MDFATRVTTPPTAVPLRMFQCIWRQGARTPHCPPAPRLDGRLALVTGGNAGIGLATTRGLAERGAEVIVAARNRATSEAACAAIGRATGATLHHVPLDLSDLRTLDASVAAIGAVAGGRRVDLLVNNAGVVPKGNARSAQGHELAFATNTLGHYALVRRLLAAPLLAERARVVVLTGDIYIRANACTPDFSYEGAGMLAYCRSKLGNLWFAAELQRRFADLEVCSVHPGVVATALAGDTSRVGTLIAGVMMLDPARGADTTLWCATQPIERGAYYHNTLGRLVLSPDDPAADRAQAEALWARLEALAPLPPA